MSLASTARNAGRGLIAGVIGTAAMTAWQELSARLQSPANGSSEPPPDPWQSASVPAQIGRRILSGVFGYDPPVDQIGLITNVMHWGYGTSWGALYGLARGRRSDHPVSRGLWFGTGVWAMSYVTLVPAGFYEPPWKYRPVELAMDLSYHLAYGAGVGAGYRLLAQSAG